MSVELTAAQQLKQLNEINDRTFRAVELFKTENGRAVCMTNRDGLPYGTVYAPEANGSWVKFSQLGMDGIQRVLQRAKEKPRCLSAPIFHCHGNASMDPCLNELAKHCWREAGGNPNMTPDQGNKLAWILGNLDLVINDILRSLAEGKTAADCLDKVSDLVVKIVCKPESSAHEVFDAIARLVPYIEAIEAAYKSVMEMRGVSPFRKKRGCKS